jgi:vacuolar-type H+-ATPase subunit I/STV1
LWAQEKLTPANLPEFLKQYDTNFSLLDQIYRELAEEELPLRNEGGQPLGRRPIEDRRQALSDLRQNVVRLAASPQDLVLTASLTFKTENLADDLFDLSQIAYDNAREELGKRLGDLQITMDHNKEMLAAYLLALAAEKQEYIARLEKEKAELERKVREFEKQKK